MASEAAGVESPRTLTEALQIRAVSEITPEILSDAINDFRLVQGSLKELAQRAKVAGIDTREAELVLSDFVY